MAVSRRAARWGQFFFDRHEDSGRKVGSLRFGASRAAWLLRRLRCEPLESRRMLTVYTVDSLGDDLLADGHVTFREALEAANTNLPVGDAAAGSPSATDMIKFAASVNNGTLNLSTGEFFVLESLSVVGPGAELLSINAGGQSRVFSIGSGVPVSLSGLTLTGGAADFGGAIWSQGALTLTRSVVSGNVAEYYGGGIYANSTTTVLSYCELSDNHAEMGGAIFASDEAELSIADCTITDNTALTAGGAIHSDSDGGSPTVTIERSRIALNSAGELGGGISFMADDPESSMTVVDSTLQGNATTGDYGFGGAIYTSGPVTISRSTISSNSATIDGGGINNRGTLTLDRATLVGNAAGYGGGAIMTSSSELTVTNSTLADNTATLSGGGIAMDPDSSGALVSVTNSTILGNSAGLGGGIDGGRDNTVTLGNCVIARNTALTDPDVAFWDDTSTLSAETDYNLIGVWDRATPPGMNSLWGTSQTPLDPGLTVVAGENGLTRHARPQPGSPVLDRGSNALAVDPEGSPLVSDMLGNPRIEGGTVDLGAVELTNSPELAVTPSRDVEILEGAALAVSVSLTAAPSGTVSVSISRQPGGSSDVTSDLGAVEFNATNWNVPQAVTISVAHDADRANDAATFRFSSDGMETIYVAVAGVDDDGQSYLVDSLADTVEADGRLTLREALAAANANQAVGDAPEGCEGAADRIAFAPGLAGGSIVLSGMQLEILDDVEILGLGAGQLAIDGGGQSRVLHVAPGVAASLRGLSITGGSAQDVDPDDWTDTRGGGIDNQGNLTFVESAVRGNSAGGSGLGIFNDTGKVTLIDSTVADNAPPTAPPTEAWTEGGGIGNQFGVLVISGSTISGNVASSGGGIVNWFGKTTITGSLVLGNAARGQWADGGGIFSYGSLVVVNSALVGNSSPQAGGAINAGGSIVVTNSTIAGNSAAEGGAIEAFYGTLTVRNSIVALNDAEDLYGELSPESGYNQVGSDPGILRNPSDGGDGWGDDPETPGVDESANDDYGDLRLRSDSPAVNAGNNAWAVDAQGNPLRVDLGGNARVLYGTVDVGAYEFGVPGDATGDGIVDAQDAAIMAAHWLVREGVIWSDGDFNEDRTVDDLDASILAAHWVYRPGGAGQASQADEAKPPAAAEQPANLRFIGPRQGPASAVAPRRLVPLSRESAGTAGGQPARAIGARPAVRIPGHIDVETIALRIAQRAVASPRSEPMPNDVLAAQDAALTEIVTPAEAATPTATTTPPARVCGPVVWAYGSDQARRPPRPLARRGDHRQAIDALLATLD